MRSSIKTEEHKSIQIFVKGLKVFGIQDKMSSLSQIGLPITLIKCVALRF